MVGKEERAAKEEPEVKEGRGQQRRMTAGKGEVGRGKVGNGEIILAKGRTLQQKGPFDSNKALI